MFEWNYYTDYRENKQMNAPKRRHIRHIDAMRLRGTLLGSEVITP